MIPYGNISMKTSKDLQLRFSPKLTTKLYETSKHIFIIMEYGLEEQRAYHMQRFYKPALKRKILTNGLNKRSRREPKLKSRVKIYYNNLFSNLNLSYNLNHPKPYNPLKLHPKPNYLNPEHINLTNVNRPLALVKGIERCLPSCSQI